MKAESETFIPNNSMLIGKTIDQLERQYKIKVLPTSFFESATPLLTVRTRGASQPKDHIHVEGEWDNVARFEKDLFTIKKTT